MYLFNKHTLLIWIVVWLLPLSAMAKRPFVETGCVTSLELQGGHSAVWGRYGAVGMSAYYSLPQYFAVQGGVQYNITNCVVADVRPAFIYHIASGRLHIEALCHYTMVQHSAQSLCFGAGVGFTGKYIWCNAGYYYRTLGISALTVAEPFNIYYELGVNCLPNVESWDLTVAVTNSNMYDLERHYQPSLQVDACWHTTPSLGLLCGVRYKPAGMFNLSSDYYQLSVNVGVVYRW